MENYHDKKKVKKYVSKTDNPNYNLHHFDVHIFCKCKDEALCRFLGDKSKGLIKIHEDLLKLKPINEFKPHEQTLIIFDDVVLDVKNHSTIQEFYVRGRNEEPVLCSFLNHITERQNHKTEYKLLCHSETWRSTRRQFNLERVLYRNYKG